MRTAAVAALLVAGLCALGAQAVTPSCGTYTDYTNAVLAICIQPTSQLTDIVSHCPSKHCRDAAASFFPAGSVDSCYSSLIASAGATTTAQTIHAELSVNALFASCSVPQSQAASQSQTTFAAAELTSLAAGCPSIFETGAGSCDEKCAAAYAHALTFPNWASVVTALGTTDAQSTFSASSVGLRVNDIAAALTGIASACTGTAENIPFTLPQNPNITIFSGAAWTAGTIGTINKPSSQRDCVAYDAKLLPNVGFVVQEVGGFEFCCIGRGILGTDPNNGEANTACLSGCGSSVVTRTGVFAVESSNVCYSGCFLP